MHLFLSLSMQAKATKCHNGCMFTCSVLCGLTMPLYTVTTYTQEHESSDELVLNEPVIGKKR